MEITTTTPPSATLIILDYRCGCGFSTSLRDEAAAHAAATRHSLRVQAVFRPVEDDNDNELDAVAS